MNQYENVDKNVESWKFRNSGEFISLFISFSLLILLGWALSLISVYFVLFMIVIGIVFIQLQQFYYLGDSVRVHSNQFPEIFEILLEYSKMLGVRKANIYIKQDPSLNAWTLGISTCTVVLTSALVEQLSTKELRFVVAHELGHFKAGHTKITSLTSPLGMNNPFSNLVMGFYERQTEYTSDRCGLVLTRNIDSAVSSLIKLSIGAELYKKLNVDGYIQQLNVAGGFGLKLGELLSNHPLTTNRIKAMTYFWNKNFINK